MQDRAAPAVTPGGLFPIRTVSTLTGVNAVTLRAWERRYGLIRPTRTAKGHRLYSQADIELINRVVNLLDTGIPISRVRQLLARSHEQEDEAPDEGEPWVSYQQRMVNAVTRFSTEELDAVYNEVLSLYPVDVATLRLIVPLLRVLGRRWEREEGGVAQEHFFGTYLRNKLGARLHHLGGSGSGPKLLGCCLPGEHHEIGLLLFALSAAARGYRLVLLGANMPLEELPVAVHRAGAAALVLSGSVEPAAGLLARQLPELVERVGVPVFVGGGAAVRCHDAIVRAGAIPLGVEINAALRHMADTLQA